MFNKNYDRQYDLIVNLTNEKAFYYFLFAIFNFKVFKSILLSIYVRTLFMLSILQ